MYTLTKLLAIDIENINSATTNVINYYVNSRQYVFLRNIFKYVCILPCNARVCIFMPHIFTYMCECI